MGDPVVRDQLKVCVDAHKKTHDALNEPERKKDWWLCVSMEELYALLDDQDRVIRATNYAERYFNDAWMDSDNESDEGTV